MAFSDIAGNEQVKKALVGMVDSGRVPHAIMFHEDDGSGAILLVNAFLQYLYCRSHKGGEPCGTCPQCNKIRKMIHPDVHYVFPVNTGSSVDYMDRWRTLVSENPYFTENMLSDALEIEGKSSMIKVEEAKSVLDILSLSALERGYRTVVVYLPEKMNREAANRLLKAIEEPPALTQFVLVTHNPDNVLQTIQSRCQRVRVMPSAPGLSRAADPVEAELLRTMMQALLAKDLLETISAGESAAALPSREKAKSFCRYAADRLRLVFLLQQGMDSLVRVPDNELAELRDWASRARKSFPRQAVDALGRAILLIDRNVNLKILFNDLTDRLYMNI